MVRLQIAVETPQHAGLSATLDYLSEQPLSAGTLVRAPLGRRDLLGIVWSQGAGELAESELRPLSAVLGELPPLDDGWRELVAFASGYYQRGLGELALSVLPPELHKLDGSQLAARLRKLHKALAEPSDTASDTAPAPSAEQAAVLDQLARAPAA
jgi:primosomal protein N' (replication factor Y)